MLRIPVRSGCVYKSGWIRTKTSSSHIRQTFIDYFVESHGHKHVKSSSVVPLCDPTVPFVNAGMNQFKGVFLGTVSPPCLRAVNSQKCVRVGGKHNDLEVVGTDGHHQTFFEMLGNWSFGDYYKKEACKMAWDLLLGPYRLKPENLVVTYFAGDIVIGLTEDRECRDIWKAIGVPESRLKALNAVDNFWEMGTTGPCGPCTEIHYVNPDGSLTEIWNLVFIQCNREANGSVSRLSRVHVDTGMGLERVAALLQAVPSNYETDLFRPLIATIQQKSKSVPPYSGQYSSEAHLDSMYRRLADHARMVSVCLADGVFPASSLNLKQIMRKSFKISTDVFQNPNLLLHLYDDVASTLGQAYPELISKEKQAKLILEHEQEAYRKMKMNLAKKWQELIGQYPEVEGMEVEAAGFPQGYREFKETMAKQNVTEIPGELVFKLYDTHGLQEDVIEKIANINQLTIDKKKFWQLLSQHRSRHKTSFKEKNSLKGQRFDDTIARLTKSGVKHSNDQHKYDYQAIDNQLSFKPLKTKMVAILNEECEWLDFLEPRENRTYYLVTVDTNFYCEEGGQAADTGLIRVNEKTTLLVDSVFKIRDFVFHKGRFEMKDKERNYVRNNSDVTLEINSERRLNVMRNHTAIHLLNAALRVVLPNSVVCQIGSSVSEKGLSLNLSVYGEKLSQDVINKAQELVRESIKANAPISTQVMDSVQLAAQDGVLTVPGELYPETGLRLVTAGLPLVSKELCCGTHLTTTGMIGEFCVSVVKGAGGHTPLIHALTGPTATEARELFCRAQKLEEVIHLVDEERRKQEISNMKRQLSEICGTGGAPYGDYAKCLALLDSLLKRDVMTNDVMGLQAVADAEIAEACLGAKRKGDRFVVHFLRCSYLMSDDSVWKCPAAVSLIVGCSGGVVRAECSVDLEHVTSSFDAERWLGCITPIFSAQLEPGSTRNYAVMTGTRVSLITCEQMVQDAMRVATKFAQAHVKEAQVDVDGNNDQPTKSQRHN